MSGAVTVVEIVAKAQRRTELQALLGLQGVIRGAHLDRAVDLALDHGWTVVPSPLARVCSCQRTRTIYTMPIWDDADLALFCHEGGHIEDRDANTRRHSPPRRGETFLVSIGAEVVAWQWAIRRLGSCWNHEMQAFMGKCLRSYGTYIDTDEERRAVAAVIRDGDDKARHVVRLLPRPEAVTGRVA